MPIIGYKNQQYMQTEYEIHFELSVLCACVTERMLYCVKYVYLKNKVLYEMHNFIFELTYNEENIMVKDSPLKMTLANLFLTASEIPMHFLVTQLVPLTRKVKYLSG